MSERAKSPDLYSEAFGDGLNTDQDQVKRIDRFSEAKSCQVVLLDYIEQIEDLRKEYEVIFWCGRMLIFRLFLRSRTYRLIGGCSCKKHLLCCLCALRRAARQSKEYEKKIRFLLAENPDWVPVLITRTVANGGSLKERFNHFVKSHKKMMSNRRQSLSDSCGTVGFAANSVMRYVHGSAGSYEFKLGENSGLWHPHTHEIALLDGSRFEFTEVERKDKIVRVPLEFESELSKEWSRATGDSWIVDVRMLDINNEEGFRKGVCESFKYALKFSDLEPSDQVEAYRTLKGRRLIFSYGALWGVKVSDSVVDTIEDALELEPYVDVIYNFAFGKGKYRVSGLSDFGKIEKNKSGYNSNKVDDLFEIHFTDGSVINQETVDDFVAGRLKEEQDVEVPF